VAEEKRVEKKCEEVEVEVEEEEDYTACDAQQEMQKIIEASLGNIACLLDSKMKKKMSFAALKAIITSVIKTTLKAAGVEDEETEKRVMKQCEEQGLLPKKKEKGSGPTNAFIVFQQEKRVEMKEQFDKKDTKEISSELGKMWQAMTEEEKKEYKDKAAKKNAEKSASSNKGSKSASKKGSKKSSSTKYTHKCCFVMTKGERANEQCGTTVRSEVPTHDGDWLCSKHVSAMKKRAESASKKSEKPKKKAKKDDEEEKSSKSKKVKKTEKKEEEEKTEKKKVKKTEKKEEEEKTEKKKVKKEEKKIVDDDEEDEKPSKPKKTEKKKEEKKKVVEEDDDELEELEEEEEGENNSDAESILNEWFSEWDSNKKKKQINGLMPREVIETYFTTKKVTRNDEYEEEGYPVSIGYADNTLCVSWNEDDEVTKKSRVLVDGYDEDDDMAKLKVVHDYIRSM
jgi:hypothetical protein